MEPAKPGLPTPSPTAPNRPRRRRPRRPFGAAAVLAAALVLVAACSGGDDAGGGSAQASTDAQADDAQAYIDAAAASLTSDEAFRIDQATATCVSTALVDVIGADALAASGITPAEFAAEDAVVVAGEVPDDATARLSEALGDCDIERAFTATFVEGLGVELPDDAVACLGDNVDPRALDDAMAVFLVPADDASAADEATLQSTVESVFLDAVTACPPVVTALFLAEAPGTVTAETQACVAAVVEADPDRVRRAMDGDDAAAQELGTEIGTACADTLGS